MRANAHPRAATPIVGMLGVAMMACSSPPGHFDVDQAVADVDERMRPLMEAAGVPGLTIAVVEHGDVAWSQAYGVASRDPERAATTETIFEGASLGKVVFALIVLRLADQGRLDLDDRIAEGFEYPLLDHDERFSRLTPRLILQHASGLPNWGGFALDEGRGPVPFRRDPGEGFDYSGEAYTALQNWVEARTGRSLEDLFAELALDAGMTHSSFISYAGSTEQYARASHRDGSERPIMLFERSGAAYSLVTTAEDLARFMAYYFGESALSEAALVESLRPVNPVTPDAWGSHVPAGADLSWSLAWGALRAGGGVLYFHAGNNGEFRSFMAYSPERHVGVAMMANGAEGLSFLSDVFTPFVGEVGPAAVWWGYESDE